MYEAQKRTAVRKRNRQMNFYKGSWLVLAVKTKPGYGVASMKERRRAGGCSYCEEARKRCEPNSEAHGSAQKCKSLN